MDQILDEPDAVVVGVDDSRSAHDAALWAADLAAVWKAPLWLTHVVNRAGSSVPDAEPAWLAELADTVRHAGVAVVRPEVRSGATSHQLMARARGARLLVLGSYGDEGWSGMLVGANALGLLGGGDCPLAVVRGRGQGLAPPRSGPIVVGVDGTEAGQAALRFATGLAAHSGHRLVAVHAGSDVRVDQAGYPHRAAPDTDTAAARQDTLRRAVAEVVPAHPGVVIESAVCEDTPLRALQRYAETAWLVVVGERSAAARPGTRGGSTSRGLVGFAPCPVIVVPTPATQTGELT